MINITAFDSALVDLLAGLQKGDAVSVMGQATIGIWNAEEGPRASVGITATRIMAMADKATQPGKRKPAPEPSAAAPEPFNDDMPF